jgi:eukaryotic-like serine/threonine-protein kinase
MVDRWFAGRYELHRQLGHGTFGEVWLAHDHNLSIQVAIKLIRNPASATAILKEASLLKSLEGERILRVSNADVFGDIAYVATEFAPGGSTEDRLREGGFLGIRPDLVVTWARQALVGLEACHRHRLIHRDIKPGNIFLTTDEWAALGDFGSAAPMDGRGLVPKGGDPLVLAPEMHLGEPGDVRADIYSMGVTMYRLMAGAWPIDDPSAAIFSSATRWPPQLRDRAPHVPEALSSIIRIAMARRPEDRYATPAEMNHDLGRLTLVSTWQPTVPHLRHVRCWVQRVSKHQTAHEVCLEEGVGSWEITTRRASGGRTRVLQHCADGIRPSELPVKLRRVFVALDRAVKLRT